MGSYKFVIGRELLCEVECASINHAACLADGHIYLFGGMRHPDKQVLDSLFVADPIEAGFVLHHVTPRGESPPARFGHSMVAHKGCLYVFGGCGMNSDGIPSDLLCDIWKFQMDSKKWVEIIPSVGEDGNTNEPTGVLFHTATVINDYMLVFGASQSFLWLFDFRSEGWNIPDQPNHDEKSDVEGKFLPLTRVKHIAAGWRNTLHIHGGCSDFGCVADHWKYDIDTNKWHEIDFTGTSPGRRHSHVGVIIGGSWIVHGGVGAKGDILHDTFEFSFLSSTWFSVKFMHCISRNPKDVSNFTPNLVECDFLRHERKYVSRRLSDSDTHWSMQTFPEAQEIISKSVNNTQGNIHRFSVRQNDNSNFQVLSSVPSELDQQGASMTHIRSNTRTRSLKAGTPWQKKAEAILGNMHSGVGVEDETLRNEIIVLPTMQMNRFVMSRICESANSNSAKRQNGQLNLVEDESLVRFFNVIPSVPLSSDIEAKICAEYDKSGIFIENKNKVDSSSKKQPMYGDNSTTVESDLSSEFLLDLSRPHKFAAFFLPSFLISFPAKSSLILGGCVGSNCIQAVNILFYHKVTEVLAEWIESGSTYNRIPLALMPFISSFLP